MIKYTHNFYKLNYLLIQVKISINSIRLDCRQGELDAVAPTLGEAIRAHVRSIATVIVLYTPTSLLCATSFFFGVGMEGFYTIYWFFMSDKGFRTTSTSSLYSMYSVAQVCRGYHRKT